MMYLFAIYHQSFASVTPPIQVLRYDMLQLRLRSDYAAVRAAVVDSGKLVLQKH